MRIPIAWFIPGIRSGGVLEEVGFSSEEGSEDESEEESEEVDSLSGEDVTPSSDDDEDPDDEKASQDGV